MADADGGIKFEPVESPIVCFASRSVTRNAHGTPVMGHSLVRTANSTYELPPMSTVTLQERRAAGTWSAFESVMQQELFVLNVTFSVEMPAGSGGMATELSTVWLTKEVAVPLIQRAWRAHQQHLLEKKREAIRRAMVG